MKQTKQNLLILILFLFSVVNLKAQTPGTTSINPILLASNTQSVINQHPDSVTKWYKLTLSQPNVSINAKLVAQGINLPLKFAEIFVKDSLNNITRYYHDSLRVDSTLFFNINNILLSSNVYLKFNFDINNCTTCSGGGITNFKFNITEYKISNSCTVTPSICEYVYNNSFENFTIPCSALGIQTAGNPYPACNWTLPATCSTGSASAGTSDYYNSCYTNATAYNYGGLNFYTAPNTGSGYAGIILYAYPSGTNTSNPYNYREYLQQQLANSLVSGQKYQLKMYVKANPTAGYYTNNLFVHLDNTFPCQPGFQYINSGTLTTGQILQISSTVITNTLNWQLYTVTFTATGNYNKMTIGNFKDDANTVSTYSLNLGASFPISYYFIDDVSIKTSIDYTVTSSNNNLCTGGSSTITINSTSNNTYNLQPGSLTGTYNIVTPTVSTNYTITATNALGCQSITIIPITVQSAYSSVTVTPITSTICAGNSVSLSASSTNSAITFYWYPVGVGGGNITVMPNATTIYTVVSGISLGSNGDATSSTCVSSHTALVNVNTLSITPSISSNSVCSGNTVTLSATSNSIGTTYIWYPVASSGANVIDNPTTSTTYTVFGTSSAGCSSQNTVSVFVFSNTPNFTYTVSNPFVCLPSNSTTITVTNSVTPVFTITSNAYTVTASNSTVLNPNVTTIYTISSNNSFGCITSQTFQIGVVSCSCIGLGGYNYSNSISLLTVPNAMGYITNDINLGGGVLNITHDEVIIYPNVQITVYPTATLNILGSHLYACGDMWNGIKVLPGGQLNILPIIARTSTTTTLIEDAKIAVDIPQNVSYTNTPNILTVQNTTFNKNNVAIKIAGYNVNQATYPFTIENSLFTSRNIPYSGLTWDNTDMVKNSSTFSLSQLATPYVNNASYPPTGIKAPFAGNYPAQGIVLNNIGVITLSTSIFRGIFIGNTSNSTNFNCFDNLRVDINALNSNFTVVNSVFQNGQPYGGRGGLTNGGQAIVAISISNPDMVSNNQANIINGGAGGTLNNYFYEKTSCADITGYLSTNIKYNQAFSVANTYTAFYAVNTIGNRGFNVKSNRFTNISIENNKVYNIKNSVLVSLDNGFYDLNNQSGAGRLVGYINVQNNVINRHPFIAFGGEYVNIGISIADPFASAATNFIPGNAVYVSATNNTITNVHNGIDAENVSFCPVSINNNNITMVNEPNNFATTPTQIGINGVQLQKLVQINQNNISGAFSYSAGVKAISTGFNTLLSVRCNTTAQTNRGLEFNNGQTIDYIEDNQMLNQKYGFVLDNNAVLTNATSSINAIGTNIRPTNNVWNGLWFAPNYKTLTTGGGSAQNGKLYVQYTNPLLDPNSSGTTGGNATFPFPDAYTYTTTGMYISQSTLLNSAIVVPNCRIGGGGTSIGLTAARTTLEKLVSNTITYTNNVSQTQIINKIMAYRAIKIDTNIKTSSSILGTFVTGTQASSYEGFCNIEAKLMNDSLAGAQVKLIAFSPSNSIEGNYKNYYQVYIKTKNNTYGSSDSLLLLNLANGCPYVDGAVVYQARALYNSIYNDFYKFTNNCSAITGMRIGNNTNADENNTPVNVILKTKLYPNPNSGLFTIELTNQQSGNVDISIIDITGKQILSEQKVITNNTISVDYNLMNGMYLVKVKLQDGSIDVHRLVISK